MASSVNIVHEMINKVGFEFDDATAKKVTQLAKKAGQLAASGMTEEASVGFAKIGEIFNKELAKLGKQKIDFSKMLEMPDSGTFENMLNTFVSQISSGLVKGINDSIGEVEKQFNSLMTRRAQAVQQRDSLEKQHRIKSTEAEKLDSGYEEVSNMMYANKKMSPVDDNFVTNAQDALIAFMDIQEKLEILNEKGKVNASTLQTWLASAKELATVYNTLSNMDDYQQNAIGAKLGKPNMKYLLGGDFENHIEFGGDMIDSFIDNNDSFELLTKARERVADLDAQIMQLTSKHPELIDKQTAIETEERLNRITEAYNRLFSISGANKGNISSKKMQSIESALNYVPYGSKIQGITVDKDDLKYSEQLKRMGSQGQRAIEALDKLGEGYINSAGSNWEVRAQNLIKFVREYESLLNNPNIDQGRLQGWADTYKELKPMATEAEMMLRNVINMAQGKELTDVSQIGVAAKDVAASAEQKRASDEASVDANAKARAEAEANAKANEDAAIAAEKERVAKEATAKASQKVGYHYGNLLGDKQGGRDTFGQTLDNLTVDGKPGTPSSYGYGIFGGGLFYVDDPKMFGDEAPSKGSKFIQGIDFSKYNLYLANTEERVTNLASLMSNLQRFAVKQAVPEYTGFDEQLSGVSIDTLWQQMNVVFENISMTKQEFNQFIQEMIKLLQSSGAYLEKETGELMFNNISDAVDGSDNMSTRLLKRLGYQGVSTAGTSFNGMAQGSVLFDFKDEDIIAFFDKLDAAIQHYNKTLTESDPSKIINSLEIIKEIDAIIERINTHKSIMLDATGGKFDTSVYDATLQALEARKAMLMSSSKDVAATPEVVDADTKTHKEKTNAINEETKAQEKLNQTKTQQAQIEQSDNDGAEVSEENAKTEAIKQQNAVLKENISLKGQANAQVTGTGTTPDKVIPTQATSDGVTSGEVANLETIKAKLLEVTDAVNTKTKAFTSEEAEVKRVAQSEIASLAEIENKATSVKAAIVNVHTSSDSVHTPNLNTEAFTQEGQAAEGAITQEMGSLTKLRAALQLTTKRINEKTQAFETEKTVVNTVVNSEINTLSRLNTHVDKVNQIVLTLLQNLQNVNTQLPNLPTGQPQGAPQGKNTGGQSGGKTSPQLFNAKIDTRFSDLSLMYAKLESVGKLTPQIEQQWLQLWNSLSKVNDTTSLQLWNEELHQVGNAMKEIMIANDLVEQEGIQSFTQLINATKLYNQMAINAAKAKTSEEKAFWEQETNKALVEQQLILNNITLTKKQQAELDALIEQRQRTINGLQAKQTGAENVRREKQEETVVVRELVELYEQLGRARAQGDYTAAGNIRGQIKAKRGQLSAVDRATDDKFAQATQRGEKTVADDANKAATKAQNEALRERGKIFGDLIKLHRELGVLEEKEKSSTLSDSKRQQYRLEIYDLYRQISAKEQLIILTREEIDLLNQTHSDAGRSARISNAGEREADIKKLAGQYAKLGEAQANAEYKGTNEAKERFTVLAKEIAEKKKSLQLTQQELDILRQIVKESYNKQGRILDQEQQDKLFKERVKEAQQQAGVNKSKTVANRAEETMLAASGIEGITPEQKANLDIYQSKILELRNTIANFPKKDGVASEAQKNQLIAQRLEVDAYTKKIQELIANYKRLSGENAQVLGTSKLGLGATADNYQKELINAVQSDPMVKGRANIRAYDAETKTLTYTLKTGRGEFTTYTASIRQADNALVSVRGTTTKAMGVFESIGKKVKEYSYYFTGSMMVYRVIGWVKQGVTAVKELDSAMTELKKVTDETEETYDKFLDTASKIGNKVGSTMKDIVSSTADWARLNI